MKVPLQIDFRRMQVSPALAVRIRRLVARLEHFSDRIMRCHITVEMPHRHPQEGRLFDIRIDIAMPGGNIYVQRAHPPGQAHADPYVALRDAFQAARRKLQDYERQHRGSAARHIVARSQKHIARLMWDHDCGPIPVCTGADGERQALGMITDRDICMSALFQGKTLSRMKVRDAAAGRVTREDEVQGSRVGGLPHENWIAFPVAG